MLLDVRLRTTKLLHTDEPVRHIRSDRDASAHERSNGVYDTVANSSAHDTVADASAHDTVADSSAYDTVADSSAYDTVTDSSARTRQ